jgi:hypothetical protein
MHNREAVHIQLSILSLYSHKFKFEIFYVLCSSGNKNGTGHEKCIELEMKEFFGRFTMDVIANCAFGVQCNSLKDPEAEFVRIAANFDQISLLSRILIFFVIFFVPQCARLLPLTLYNKQVSLNEI